MQWLDAPSATRPCQVTEAVAKASRDERQGLLVDRVPDVDLFYVDKASRSACRRIREGQGGRPRSAPLGTAPPAWLTPPGCAAAASAGS